MNPAKPIRMQARRCVNIDPDDTQFYNEKRETLLSEQPAKTHSPLIFEIELPPENNIIVYDD